MAFDPYINNDKILSILEHVRIARVLSIATFDRVKKDHLNPGWPLSSETIIGNRIFPDHHTILINSINLGHTHDVNGHASCLHTYGMDIQVFC